MTRFGIGIVTFNRPATVRQTLDAVRRHTRSPFHVVIADDGSAPEVIDQLRPLAPLITGRNHGVAWNKNRALFHLRATLGCDTIILIEDDVQPTELGWEESWIEAARLWGHANLAGNWFRDSFVRGAGTPADPFLSRDFSGQCTAFSGEAIDHVGYLDVRYRGFGIGHVDHTRRLGRVGYGATRDPQHNTLFHLIESPLNLVWTETSRKEEDVKRNHALYQTLQHETVFRAPWSTDEELREFRSEQRALMVPKAARVDPPPSTAAVPVQAPQAPVVPASNSAPEPRPAPRQSGATTKPDQAARPRPASKASMRGSRPRNAT